MNTWIAFIRGINVGGRRLLPMKELARALQALGLENVRTYIQSGNVVFRSSETDTAALSARIEDTVEAGHGFRPRVLVLSHDAIRSAASACPFPTDETGAKSVHFFFLASPPAAPDLTAMDGAKAADEEYALGESVLFMHAPSGFGRSRLAERMERLLGVPTTARNLRTVTKVLAIAAEIDR